MFFKLIFIAACVGGEIVSTFGRPELVRLGECKLIEEVMIGEDKVSFCGWTSFCFRLFYFVLLSFAEVCHPYLVITRSPCFPIICYFPDSNPVHSLVLICVAGKYIHLFV